MTSFCRCIRVTSSFLSLHSCDVTSNNIFFKDWYLLNSLRQHYKSFSCYICFISKLLAILMNGIKQACLFRTSLCYAGCRYAECHYAECRAAIFGTKLGYFNSHQFQSKLLMSVNKMINLQQSVVGLFVFLQTYSKTEF